MYDDETIKSSRVRVDVSKDYGTKTMKLTQIASVSVELSNLRLWTFATSFNKLIHETLPLS